MKDERDTPSRFSRLRVIKSERCSEKGKGNVWVILADLWIGANWQDSWWESLEGERALHFGIQMVSIGIESWGNLGKVSDSRSHRFYQ